MHWPKSSDESRLKVSGVSERVCGMGSFSESWDAPRRDQVPKSGESAVELHCGDSPCRCSRVGEGSSYSTWLVQLVAQRGCFTGERCHRDFLATNRNEGHAHMLWPRF